MCTSHSAHLIDSPFQFFWGSDFETTFSWAQRHSTYKMHSQHNCSPDKRWDSLTGCCMLKDRTFWLAQRSNKDNVRQLVMNILWWPAKLLVPSLYLQPGCSLLYSANYFQWCLVSGPTFPSYVHDVGAANAVYRTMITITKFLFFICNLMPL